MIRIQGASFQFTIYEYTFLVGIWTTHHQTWRLGQTYFNVLNIIAPKLADEIRGTELDPFYKERDDGIEELIEWLETKRIES